MINFSPSEGLKQHRDQSSAHTRVSGNNSKMSDKSIGKNNENGNHLSTKRMCSREHRIQQRDWSAKNLSFLPTNHITEFFIRRFLREQIRFVETGLKVETFTAVGNILYTFCLSFVEHAISSVIE